MLAALQGAPGTASGGGPPEEGAPTAEASTKGGSQEAAAAEGAAAEGEAAPEEPLQSALKELGAAARQLEVLAAELSLTLPEELQAELGKA